MYSEVSTSNPVLDNNSLLKYLFLFLHRENALHAKSFVMGKTQEVQYCNICNCSALLGLNSNFLHKDGDEYPLKVQM